MPKAIIRSLTVLTPAILVIIVYLPGLTGDFHFDDRPNLRTLQHLSDARSVEDISAYLEEAPASDLGRPVSMLTFALNAQTWPADPRPFLITNVAIHAINAGLLTLILLLICRHARPLHVRGHAVKISMLGATLWACHPFLVSTTLFIVQRMALLAAFFSLLSICIYIWVRSSNHRHEPITRSRFLAWASLLFLCMLLGILSKENAAIIPALLLIVEYTVLRHLWYKQKPRGMLRGWIFLVAALPTAAVVVALGEHIYSTGLIETLETRNFSGLERIFTQPTILLYYLYSLLIPQPGYPGLFYDGHSLEILPFLNPGAWIAIAMATLVVVAATLYRAHVPTLSLGILFFFAAHAIESLHPALEPIFEHRNYLPSAFVFFPAATFLAGLESRAIRRMAGLSAMCIICIFTLSRTSLWGKPTELSLTWAYTNTWSTRAQIEASSRLLRAGGKSALALQLLDRSKSAIEDSAPIYLTEFIARKRLGMPASALKTKILEGIEQGRFDPHVPKIASVVVDSIRNDGTQVFSERFAMDILKALLNNPKYGAHRFRSNILLKRLELSVLTGDIEYVCHDAEVLWRESHTLDTALLLSLHLAAAGYLNDSLRMLERAEHALRSQNRMAPGASQRRLRDIKEIRENIQKEARGDGQGEKIPLCSNGVAHQ